MWRFDTNFNGLVGHVQPLAYTNISLAPDWDGNGLLVDSTNAAFLTYPVVTTNGWTNLDCLQGSVEVWYAPSTSAGGSGNCGTLLEVGTWSTNAMGAWGLYIDNSNIWFAAQSNGFSTNYLSAPINWNAGEWHHIMLTYSATNSSLYLEGQLVTNGPAVSLVPGPDVLTNGFSIGSDGNPGGTGLRQAHGVYNQLISYNYQVDADTIAENYAYDTQYVYPLPSSGGRLTMNSDSGPPTPPGDGSDTNSSGSGPTYSAPQYGSNDFWLEALPLGTNAYNADPNSLTLILHGTISDIDYQILSTTNLQASNTVWTVEQDVIGSETTNFTVPTIPLGTNGQKFFKALAYGLDSDGGGLPDWWQLKYFGHLGVDPYASPAGDGWNNLQKYQLGMNPNMVYAPPPPIGLTATMDTNGNVTLRWPAAANLPNSGAGAVTGYTLGLDYTNITVSAGQTNYTDSLANNPLLQYFFESVTNTFLFPWTVPNYSLQVNYANTNSQVGSINPRLGQQFSIQAYMVRGAQGQMNLVVSAMPTNLAALRVYYSTDLASATYPINAAYLQPAGTINIADSFFDVPASSFTNGVALISDSQLPLYGLYQFVMFPIGDDGTLGSPSYSPLPGVLNSPLMENIPFFDGRTHIEQNLAFWLRAADGGGPFYFNVIDAETNISAINGPVGFAYAGFHMSSESPWPFNDRLLNEFQPFEENYMLRNFALGPTNVLSDGELAGIFGSIWDFFPHSGLFITNLPLSHFDTYQYALAGSRAPIPAVLGSVDTQWFESWADYLGHLDPIDDGDTALAYIGIQGAISPYLWPERSQNFYMPVGETNIFGLPYLSAAYEYTNGGPLQEQTIYGGGSSVSNYFGYFYPQTAQPQLQTAGYYFGRPGIDPLPIYGDAGFSLTNTTPYPFIIPFGQSFSISAWAKQVVTNGYNGTFGYAEQYFDRANEANTNGNISSVLTGILSEYGDFFPTQPGKVFLTTKPDASTGSTGECVLNVVKIQLDVNHDGVMDFSFAGPDNTSPDTPFVFWNNNNFDRLSFDKDDSTNYDDDVLSADCPATPHWAMPDSNYRDINSNRLIPSQRDLQDFARLWIVGLSDCLSNLPSSDIVTLSWEDYAGVPFSNDPTIDVFQAADADGGIGYLTDSTTASLQTNIAVCRYVGRVGSGQSIQLNASKFKNSWAGDRFIWCGVQPGTGQLALTITDTNGNTVLATYAYIQIKDIKDMYERWTVGDNPHLPPTNNPVLAYDNLPQGDIRPFQYTLPTDTNTPYILYVHGWNMGAWIKDRFAETAFKRLYWQGYQGRFGVFRWPTDYDFNGGLMDALFQPHNYDDSENYAWQSATGLTNLLTSLNGTYPGHVFMLAHSMGNVVAGEALRLSGSKRIVNTYVASQAAIPAHVYDSTVTNLIYFTYTSSKIPNYLNWQTLANYGPQTPNIYGNRLAGNSAAVGRRINFYNVNDFALSPDAWCFNQELKPDVFVGSGYYSYNGGVNDPAPWNNFQYIVYSPDGPNTDLDIVNSQQDIYEVFAFAAESRSTAFGATPAVGGVANVNLQAVWPSDPSGHSYSDHFWHSGEFRGTYYLQQDYWGELLGAQGFNIK